MTITEQTPIGEIAAAVPSSVRVFQRHGIDFCCGGKRPLSAVCAEQGLSFAGIVDTINASVAPAADNRDWTKAPLGELVDSILVTYHDPLREELPRLEELAARVVHVHGDKAPYLTRVHEILGELSADLHNHMRKEELVLFPALRALDEGRSRYTDWLAAPIAVMEHEHDRAGALLAELRRLTGNYVAPDWACATFRALFAGLDELEASMHVHVHLENNVLFPRALKRHTALPNPAASIA